MKKVGIVAIDIKTAKEYFNNIIGEIKYKDIKTIIKNFNKYFAELIDGTIYEVIPASEVARGYKFTDLYIQKGIDKKLIASVILPMLYRHDDGSESTITYFE